MATWETNDTERIVVTVTESGVNVDSLIGATVAFSLYKDGTEVLTKATVDFTASAPTFTCDLDAADLADFETGIYEYEIRVTDLAGSTQSATGTLSIQAVTI